MSQSSSRTRAPTLWSGPFVIASVANLLTGMGVMLMLHLPGLLERWGESKTTIGVFVAAMAVGSIAVRPFAGLVMDGGRGRRPVILVAGVAHVVACAGYLAVSDAGPLLLGVRVLHGLAGGALFASLFTTAADLVPAQRRTEGLALFGVSGMLPVALGGVVGDLVLAHADYRELFLVCVGCTSAALLVALALPETGAPRGPDAVRANALRGRGFFAVAAQRDLLPIWVVGIAFAGALGTAYAFLKPFVLSEHVGSVGLFYGWYAAMAIALRLTLGWLPDRLGPKRVLAPSLLAISVALAALSLARTPLAIGAAGALAGLGHGFAFPILTGLTAGRSRDEERGSALSLFTAVFDVGLLAGPSFGMLAEATSLRTMFLVAAAVPLLGGAVFYVWEARSITPAARSAS
ncbi:MAG: MFS transporter [Myxococcota bacterium]|nr:MFS transporter [Myxococcota bacterium]